MLRPALAMTSAVLLLPACADAPDASDVQRSDSAGVEVVTSGSGDRPLDVSLAADFRLGGNADGEDSFYAVDGSTVGTDAEGNIYVLDRDGYRVAVFDGQGGFLRFQGSQGEGPGEMEWPFALVVEPGGTVLVFDLGKASFVVYGPDGEALPSRERPEGFRGGTLRSVAGDVIYVDRAEDGVEALKRRGDGGDETSLARVHLPAGTNVELESCGMMMAGMVPLFTPSLRWAAAGGRLAVATGAAYSVDILEGDRVVRRVRRDLAPASAGEADAVREVGDGMSVMTSMGERMCDAAEVVEQRGFAATVPAVGSLFLFPDGRLWVQREGVGDDPTPVDAFGPDGAYMGTLPPGTPLPIGALPDGRILWEERDALDVERLVVGRMVEGGP